METSTLNVNNKKLLTFNVSTGMLQKAITVSEFIRRRMQLW